MIVCLYVRVGKVHGPTKQNLRFNHHSRSILTFITTSTKNKNDDYIGVFSLSLLLDKHIILISWLPLRPGRRKPPANYKLSALAFFIIDFIATNLGHGTKTWHNDRELAVREFQE